MQTRRQRQFRTNLKRIVVGIFLVIFIASVVGVALISVTGSTR
jgi:ABC-type transporter Mla subunit MlaD